MKGAGLGRELASLRPGEAGVGQNEMSGFEIAAFLFAGVMVLSIIFGSWS